MAVDMFIKIKGIEGESTDKKHAKEIDVLSWSWGMSQSGTTHMGGGGGSGKVNVQDLSFTKYVDASSHALIAACCNGKHHDDAILYVRKAAGKGEPIEYIKITMSEVMVTNVTTGGSGGEDRLSETISLNFAKVKFEYTPQKPDGTKDTTKETTWDIASNADE